MSKVLTLTVPDEVAEALQEEAARSGRTPEQIGMECIAQHTRQSKLGSPDAVAPFFGAWSMTAEERKRIEQIIVAERHLEENGQGIAVQNWLA